MSDMRRLTPATTSWLFVVVLAAVSLAAACGGTEQAPEPAPAPPAETPETAAGIDPAVLANPERPEAERAQDEGRKPLQVYEFLEIGPGMTVADVWSAGGYNTHLLSLIVGDQGRVYSVTDFYETFQDGAFAQQLRDRVASLELQNVEIVESIGGIPAGSLDVAIAIRNYHDVYGFGGDPGQVVADLFAAVRAGGIVGIVEVAAGGDGWDADAHRLGRQTVVDDFTGGGFELADSSDMLSNPADDHTSAGFSEGRHTLDRYVLKFRKPQGRPAP